MITQPKFIESYIKPLNKTICSPTLGTAHSLVEMLNKECNDNIYYVEAEKLVDNECSAMALYELKVNTENLGLAFFVKE